MQCSQSQITALFSFCVAIYFRIYALQTHIILVFIRLTKKKNNQTLIAANLIER